MNGKRLINRFSEKILIWPMGHFGLKIGASSKLLVCCKNFVKILLSERGRYIDENCINNFFQKHFGPKNGTSA